MNFDQAMAAFEPALPLAVAYSGGADSTALLVACAARWPGRVEAFHVHHGLQAAADDFERHCAAVCERLGVPLRVQRIDARHMPGESPEDAARRARYASFAALATVGREQGALESIALGQHADDQVETVVLALSRGAGLAGLAAMPPVMERDGLRYHRPLLAVPAAEIRAWLTAREVPWIEDPSNADPRYTRNRIRAELLPALERAFPQFRATFARSARHAAQAQLLLAELAQQDLASVGSPPDIKALQQMSRARQANLLRHWLLEAHGCTPSTVQLDELLDQIAACTTRGHGLHIKLGAGFVERQGPVLGWYNSAPPTKPLR
ncbi:tRNA lysidine(34) synthetase TilS [Variovorax fucosicus]|uniref:tRNA lysidine(34) synthetase TilS n=1 Tax=Variovorax fucosicus TaxID=3053517 RepID=UPI002574F237|nr:tRNA lysidine(34) synthetase TilS [Variovorax sp. J22G47]MDM0057141.1 tRNA lysidine(34) synthetase TilS [Variovorax sp. J22G47]